MLRRTFLSSIAASSFAAYQTPPNIVFVLIDDMGWRDTGYNGSKFYETPNIDKLARSGMTFTNGYSASPVCSPTRAAIMTGRYPARLHLTAHLQGASNRFPYTKVLQPNTRLELPHAEVTIAELLREKGYRTACIGKWHLGKKGFLPADQGFDVSMAGDEAGSTSSFFYPDWKKKVPLEGKPGDYLTDRLTDGAVDFISANHEKPFFLYLPHFAVHTPIQGKPDKVKKYAAKSNPADPQNYDEYAAMIESVDESVGRVIGALEKNGILQNTLVIFTSDNGGVSSREWKNRPVTSNLPLRAGKGHIYEGGIRVPAIASWQGVIRPGSTCEDAVQSIDYAPTIAEIAGIDRNKTHQMDGVSITRLFRGGKLPERDLFWHYPHYSPQLGRPASALRHGDYKLIHFFEDGQRELYNLRTDVSEKHNLIGSEQKVGEAMGHRLDAWWKSTKAQIPELNPNYDPSREREMGEPTGPVPAK